MIHEPVSPVLVYVQLVINIHIHIYVIFFCFKFLPFDRSVTCTCQSPPLGGQKSFLANAKAAVPPMKVYIGLKSLRTKVQKETADVAEHLHTPHISQLPVSENLLCRSRK